jgi:signal transduction histidine kinase
MYRDCLTDGDPIASYGYNPWLELSSAARLLAIPLQVEGRIIGLVEVLNQSVSDDFTTPQISQAMRHAVDIGVALDRYQSLYGRQQMLEASRNLAMSTSGDWVSIYTWDKSADTLTRVIDYGTSFWIDQPTTGMPVSTVPTLKVVLEEQRTAMLRSSDKTLAPSEKELFRRPDQGTLLLLPLIFKARTVGLVQLLDINPGREFSEREMGLAQALANQAAIALENAHLVADLQKSLQEQKAMQGHMVRAARLSALGEMSAVIAHQINNPLTTILGDAEMLVQDIPSDNPNHDSAEAIRRAGRRAKLVVERMLSMVRNEVDLTAIDVAQTIRDTVELVGAQIEHQGIKLTVDVNKALPRVMAVPGQLEDVWMNMLLNARDAVAERRITGEIAIRAQITDNGCVVRVAVEDNGSGIAPADMEKLFDPMFTTKPSGRGTGLGLYICRQIIQDHNGAIHVDSTPGSGTSVIVDLPAIVNGETRSGKHSDRR